MQITLGGGYWFMCEILHPRTLRTHARLPNFVEIRFAVLKL